MTDLVPGLQLHILLAESAPPIERTLSVAANIPLSDLHRCIQAAFGWQNRHLYQFAVSDTFRGDRLFTEAEAAEELDVEDASRVTLAEIAGRTGARLAYEYDFGDAWDHSITVVGDEPVPRSLLECIAALRRGPVEDCGGIHGYHNLIEALRGNQHDSADAVEWFESVTGESAARFDPAGVDLEAINRSLGKLSQFIWGVEAAPEVMADVVLPVQWLLQRVGSAGIALTKDGYLKPAVVQEAMQELRWEDRWYGKFNRESQTLPILDLRQQTQRWKLLRTFKGKLVRTPIGRRLVGDDTALWDYLAEQIAHPGNAALELIHAVVVQWVVEDKVPPFDVRGEVMARLLNAGGFWSEGRDITASEGRSLVRDALNLLGCLNLYGKSNLPLEPNEPSDGGRQFLTEIQRRQHHRS